MVKREVKVFHRTLRSGGFSQASIVKKLAAQSHNTHFNLLCNHILIDVNVVNITGSGGGGGCGEVGAPGTAALMAVTHQEADGADAAAASQGE